MTRTNTTQKNLWPGPFPDSYNHGISSWSMFSPFRVVTSENVKLVPSIDNVPPLLWAWTWCAVICCPIPLILLSNHPKRPLNSILEPFIHSLSTLSFQLTMVAWTYTFPFLCCCSPCLYNPLSGSMWDWTAFYLATLTCFPDSENSLH